MRDYRTWSDPSSLGEDDRTAEILDTLFGPHRAVKRLSDAEIAQLVSVALNDALLALGRTYPKRTLESRAKEAQSGLQEQFRALPPVQRSDPTVRAEYRKAVVLQDVTRDLAFRMVNAIQRYAAVSEREVPNQIM